MSQYLWEHTGRDYATVETPHCMRWMTDWPVPAPDVVSELLHIPLRGLWIDHVPSGAEITALNLLRLKDRKAALEHPLATGDWSGRKPIWLGAHPEVKSPQRVMPDSWFDHPGARKPPPRLPHYTPSPGNTVYSTISSSLCGMECKHEARRLPELWAQGLLRTPEDRSLAELLIRHIKFHSFQWHQMILDEGWTIRRAAQILREAGCWIGPVCAWTNRWALPPPGTPLARSAPEESPEDIARRCWNQTADDGPWPLSQTEAIAAAHDYRRVE